ncbi:hypothetical protein LRS74_19555 [Streptomyces sp. LX-29]|uniref:hypothetical protein n=1 Tax=Streptomyces sp. LX-29 TaxID=2900152 RepID=UPI00240E568C|nr:hypothetical protein [Streptomyces sp. LX-29]WFB08993.1 hypothetical protein LRS74_19555 [Streptomyces sp. LX-29]
MRQLVREAPFPRAEPGRRCLLAQRAEQPVPRLGALRDEGESLGAAAGEGRAPLARSIPDLVDA